MYQDTPRGGELHYIPMPVGQCINNILATGAALGTFAWMFSKKTGNNNTTTTGGRKTKKSRRKSTVDVLVNLGVNVVKYQYINS